MGDICKIDLRIFFVYSQESYWNHTWKFIGSSIQMNFHSKPMNFLLLWYFWHLDAALAPNFFARPALRNSHCKGTENCINAIFCIFRCLKFSNEYINMLVNLIQAIYHVGIKYYRKINEIKDRETSFLGGTETPTLKKKLQKSHPNTIFSFYCMV